MLIGEVAEVTGVSTKTLRFYEDEGLLHEPDRTAGGYRDYRPDVIDRVVFIRQAQAAGLTLNQIAEVLTIRDGGRAPCGHVARLVDDRLADVEARLAELGHTRRQLRELRSRLDELDTADCPPDDICVAVSGR
jgi:DNA-binding transcriptional MerR regulator